MNLEEHLPEACVLDFAQGRTTMEQSARGDRLTWTRLLRLYGQGIRGEYGRQHPARCAAVLLQA